MLLSMAVFWGGLFALIVWAVRQFTPGSGQGRPDPTTILEERFARGEMSKEELEEGRRVLNTRWIRYLPPTWSRGQVGGVPLRTRATFSVTGSRGAAAR